MSPITLMAAGAVAFNALLVAGILALFAKSSRELVLDLARRYGLLAIFVISVFAVLGSLWMQYFGNLQPCVLCWWQRICMYPIPLITLITFVKNKDFSGIADYVLAFSVIGACIALYQHLLQMLPAGSLIPCDASNDCAIRSVFEFGYVTLPWIALSTFALFIFIALVGRRR